MGLEEQVVQKFPYRCPYCDQPVSYDRYDLQEGETPVRCPSCGKTYIRVITESPKTDES
jgi:DNA-directed RNA polymerase subunit RPC12/RpoP